MTATGARTAVPATKAKRPLSVVLFVSGEELDRRHHERGSGVIDGERQMGSPHRSARDDPAIDARTVGATARDFPVHGRFRAYDAPRGR